MDVVQNHIAFQPHGAVVWHLCADLHQQNVAMPGGVCDNKPGLAAILQVEILTALPPVVMALKSGRAIPNISA